MATIGVIDIAMRASTEKFTKGLQTASASLNRFLKSIKPVGQEILKLGTIATGGAVAALTALSVSSLHAANDTAELAAKVGVSAKALDAFRYAVKLTDGPVDDLPVILGKLNATLGDAANSATPAAAAFRRLGLDAKKLASEGPIEAIKAIADKLASIESPAERAAIATDVFGKKGIELIPTLAAGGDAIRELEAQAKRLGITLEDVDYAKIAAANDALDRAGEVISGIGKQLAAQLAPFITAAADKFTELATSGNNAGKVITGGIESVASGLAIASDFVRGFKANFVAAQASISKVLSNILYGLLNVRNALDRIPGISFDPQTTDNIEAAAEALDDLAGDQAAAYFALAEAPPAAQGVKKFFDGIRESADKAAAAINGSADATKGMGKALGDAAFRAAELEREVKDQIATIGMSTVEAKAYALAQDGASAADVSRLVVLGQQLKAAEDEQKAKEKLEADAKQLRQETRTAQEQLEQSKEHLGELFGRGLIDRRTLDRGLKKLDQDAGINDVGRAGAVEKGSTEARSAILNFRMQTENTGEAAQRRTAENTFVMSKGINVMVGYLRAQAQAPTLEEQI